MISVPARRVKQFGVEFYQAGLSAKDIDRLVKFEVLGYTGGPEPDAKGKKSKAARARVNWDMLEKRISESETAYQRPVIRRKIDELAAYYRECKDAATLPAIPGAEAGPARSSTWIRRLSRTSSIPNAERRTPNAERWRAAAR